MSRRRVEWRRVLDSEVQVWLAKPCEHLVSELREPRIYEVELDSKKYQVEVEILENTSQYVHVIVSVDDGSLPASLLPLTQSFMRQKSPSAVE